MINIKEKREKNGFITHLKSEYGNIFTRDMIIDLVKKGYKFYVIEKGRKNSKIHLVYRENGFYISTKKGVNSDVIEGIPDF
jgi:hypothetical protein